jgi:hypothetical protein
MLQEPASECPPAGSTIHTCRTRSSYPSATVLDSKIKSKLKLFKYVMFASSVLSSLPGMPVLLPAILSLPQFHYTLDGVHTPILPVHFTLEDYKQS